MAFVKLICIWALLLVTGASTTSSAPVDASAEEVPKAMSLFNGHNAAQPCEGYRVIKLGYNMFTWYKCDQMVAAYRADNEHRGTLKLVTTDTVNTRHYLCKVTAKEGPDGNYVINVEANVPPLNVSIRTDNNDDFEAGNPRVLACVVYGGVPSPNVTWYLGDTMLRPNVYKEVNRGNFTVSSLTFVPSLIDNGKELVCKATNEIQGQSIEDRVVVNVGHRPMCIDSGFKTIGAVDGESETVVCMVESEPEPKQFTWTFADGRTIYTSSKRVSGHDNRYTSTLVWVPREDDFGPLYCRASNRFGEQKLPCTFSVIIGGPPTTPECQMFWADLTTLKVRCDKNWDGGRQQTIHLEVKGPDGIRKVSRKGLELAVSSLDARTNITAELYASNHRGKSSTIRLALLSGPRPDVDFDTGPALPDREFPLLAIFIVVALGFCIMGFIIIAIKSCLYRKNNQPKQQSMLDYELGDAVQGINATIPDRLVYRHTTSFQATDHTNAVSSTMPINYQDSSGNFEQFHMDFRNASAAAYDGGVGDLFTDHYYL